MTTHWLNLTNGLRALEEYDLPPERVRYMRVPSTWCEQHRWGDILFQLPDEFLLRAALAETLVVHDYSARGGCSRAVWQGLEWIKLVLARRWLQSNTHLVTGRMSRGQKYLEAQYARLPRRVKKRLDYYKKFVSPGTVLDIRAVVGHTDLDGKYTEHVRMLKEHSCTSLELIPVKMVG